MTSPDPSRRWALIKRREKGPEDVPASQRRQGFQERDAVYAQVPVHGFAGFSLGFPGGSVGKASASNAGDPGSIPGLGRSAGEGNGNPLQYSCLENPMD